MKRDLDLIRSFLLTVEADGDHAIPTGHTDEKVADHAQQLIEEGWIEGAVVRNHQNVPPGFAITRLTSKGHDFIDATRNPNVWKKANG
jgi:Hypothetical protein (DUF2513)